MVREINLPSTREVGEFNILRYLEQDMNEHGDSQTLEAELGIGLEYSLNLWAAFWNSTVKNPLSYTKLFTCPSSKE